LFLGERKYAATSQTNSKGMTGRRGGALGIPYCLVTHRPVHLWIPVAIHSVAFSGKSFFMPDSSGAFMKASLEIHALINHLTEINHHHTDLASTCAVWCCKFNE